MVSAIACHEWAIIEGVTKGGRTDEGAGDSFHLPFIIEVLGLSQDIDFDLLSDVGTRGVERGLSGRGHVGLGGGSESRDRVRQTTR